MPIDSVFFRNERWFHHGEDFATGPVNTTEFNLIPAVVSVHTALSAVQATEAGPLGAAVGIMEFGTKNFGPFPFDWQPQAFGKTGFFVTATQVTKGEMSVAIHFHVFS
jgi:hypothetical protein